MLIQHTARVPDEERTNGNENTVKNVKEKAISETKDSIWQMNRIFSIPGKLSIETIGSESSCEIPKSSG